MGAAEKLVKPLVIDGQLKNEVSAGVAHVFSVVSGYDVKLIKDETVRAPRTSTGDVSGVIGLVQDKLEGNMVVSFPKELILGITTAVYQEETKEITDSVKQIAGEFTNMIMGQIKSRLNERGYCFKLTIPSVITGSQHNIVPFDTVETLYLKFDCGPSYFECLISLKQY